MVKSAPIQCATCNQLGILEATETKESSYFTLEKGQRSPCILHGSHIYNCPNWMAAIEESRKHLRPQTLQ